MITAPSIKNYALIEKLSIDFFKRFFNHYGGTGAKINILPGLVLGKSRPNIIENKDVLLRHILKFLSTILPVF
jgi:hypothetical protein